MMENQENKSTSNIQYLTFDENGKICYAGFCKLKMNCLTKYLTVDPLADDIKPIGASFDWTFIKEKHILCILSPNNVQDFILVFKNNTVCKRAFTAINKYKTDTVPTLNRHQIFQDRFLLPLFSELGDPNIVKILSPLIGAYNEREKRNLIQFLEKQNLYETAVSTFGEQLHFVKQKPLSKTECLLNSQTRQTRKRKFAEIDKSKCATASEKERNLHESPKEYTRVVHSPEFKLMRAPLRVSRILIVYTSPELTTFHEYKCSTRDCTFVCVQCNRENTAITEVDENGDIQVKLTSAKHLCKPSKDIPENYTERTFVKKSNYKIVQSGKSNKLLVIFDSDNPTNCYEYYWRTTSQRFYCRGCYNVKSKVKNKSKARIYYEGAENEYVEILNNKHICQKRLYDPEKYQQFREFVLHPDFEIYNVVVKEKKRKRLIIFDKNDRNLCYYYAYVAYHDCFFCVKCRSIGNHVSAKLQTNNDGEEYVLLLNTNHICQLQKYISPTSDIILRPLEIEYMKKTKSGVPKLLVFGKNGRNTCYVFTQINSNNPNFMYCLGCYRINRKEAKVTGYLCKNEETGNYTFRIKCGQKHICQPNIYNPEDYQSFETFDFFYYRQRNKPQSVDLAIYHGSDKTLCYTFGYMKSENAFICKKCDCIRKKFRVRTKENENGEEYFDHNPKKHFCQPIKVSSISGPKFIKLQCNDICQKPTVNVTARPKIKKESKIIRQSDFELQPNLHGVLDKRLIVFLSDDKSLVYQYCCYNDRDEFVCSKCQKKKIYVSAKLHIDENGEKYVALCKTEHICKPNKYMPPIKIVESSNFKLFYQNDDSNPTKLVVFTTSSHELCYEYTYQNDRKCFRCTRCRALSDKFVPAKLMKRDNNETYVLLSSNKHVCEPEKLEEPVIIPEAMFQLCENTKGENDKHLLLYTSEKKDMAYKYSITGNLFVCIACRKKKIYVTAKLKEDESGKRFLQLLSTKHVCVAKKV